MVGAGNRGNYLLKHLKAVDSGRGIALCGISNGRTNPHHTSRTQ